MVCSSGTLIFISIYKTINRIVMVKFQKNPTSFNRWMNWFLPALFYFYQSGVQALPSLTHDYLKGYFRLTELEVAFIPISFLTPYILMLIPYGIIFDHFNSRKVLTLALLLFSCGFFLLYLADIRQDYNLYLLGMFVQGISSSCACLAAIYMANTWLNDNEYKLAVSLTAIMSISGFLLLSILFNCASEFFSYASILLVNGALSLSFMLVIFFYLKDPAKKQELSVKIILKNLKKTFTTRIILITAIYNGCLYTNISLLANLWRIDFLKHHFFLTQMQATLDNGFTLLGYMMGSLFYGLAAQRTNQLARMMLFSAFALFMVFFTCHFLVSDVHFKLYFYFVMGFLTSSLVLSYTLIKQKTDPLLIGISLGLILLSQKLIGMLLMPLMAFLYQISNANYMLATIPVVVTSFIAIICSTMIPYLQNGMK